MNCRVLRPVFDLALNTDQVRQAHVEADLQWQEVAAPPVALPAGSQGHGPVDGGSGSGQQGLDASQHGIGALKKSIQSGVHVFSSDKFTVMMALLRRNAVLKDGSTHPAHTGRAGIQR